jgi:hypothetical protein
VGWGIIALWRTSIAHLHRPTARHSPPWIIVSRPKPLSFDAFAEHGQCGGNSPNGRFALDPGVLLLTKPYRKSQLANMIRRALTAEPTQGASFSSLQRRFECRVGVWRRKPWI